MIQARQTPGVYIKELNAFPNSVVQVATALPVFIGYTETTMFQGMSLQNKVVEIASLADYNAMFGGAPDVTFAITPFKPVATNPNAVADVTLNGAGYTITPSATFYMYNSLQLFFQNGGGTCYIFSIGTYANEGKNGPSISNYTKLSGAAGGTIFDVLKTSHDPTMILIPDALAFGSSADYYTLMNDCLGHCYDVQSRITLIDAFGGSSVSDPLVFNALQSSNTDPVSLLRNGVVSPFLNYGVAYYPWLNASVVTSDQLDYTSLVNSFVAPLVDSDTKIAAKVTTIISNLKAAIAGAAGAATPQLQQATINAAESTAHNGLLALSPNYLAIVTAILLKVNCLPATPGAAGCICTVDGSQGVWKAPANISLNAVQSPIISINDDLQANMNVDAVTGKSVNAIRPFTGFGTVIWGARTLDGNSQDWRYVNVRRTLIMIEQSIKLAARSYVFASNDANTWLNLKSEIETFLTGIWKQGGLAGSKPEEAFSVSVGIGSTMTANDILDGYLDVAVLVAVTHPAEFIEITFQQQLQKS
jgi:phage tail sheath protein FI